MLEATPGRDLQYPGTAGIAADIPPMGQYEPAVAGLSEMAAAQKQKKPAVAGDGLVAPEIDT